MTQNTPTPQWKSLIGCLGRRVLSISFLLLVVPLLVHALLLFKEARHKSIIDNLHNISLIARSEATYLQQLILKNLSDLKTIELLGEFSKKDFTSEHSNFSEIAVSSSMSSFFLAEKTQDANWQIIAAAHPDRLIQKDIDPDEYEKVLVLGNAVYLFHDALTQKKELRIGYAIGESRVLISGTPLDTVSSILVRAPSMQSTPIAAFCETDSDLFYASNQGFDLTQTKLFTPEELIDVNVGPLSHFSLNQNDLFVGVKTPIAGNSFYLVMALTKSQFIDISSEKAFNHLLQLTLLFVLIGGGGVFYLTSRIASPLKQLFYCLDKVGEGDLKVRYQNDRLGFELNILGQKFNQMLANLETNIQEAKKQKMAKELLKQEFQIGQDIQKSILRSSLKEAGDFVFSTSFTPAKEVSGDFYDVYKISENKILICVADTAGKGISACLYSLGARSMLRALAKSGISLEKIIKEMNELFLDDAENQGAFITAFIGLLDLETSQLTYASCGHPSAYLITNQRVESLQGEGMALGADLNLVYAIHHLDMKQGDKILIYTDGVIEAQNQNSEMYTPSRLNRFLESQKVHTAAVCVHDLSSDVMAFTDKAELHDDVTILCFEKRK